MKGKRFTACKRTSLSGRKEYHVWHIFERDEELKHIETWKKTYYFYNQRRSAAGARYISQISWEILQIIFLEKSRCLRVLAGTMVQGCCLLMRL
jgi:hypothetical protein